jgi:hypothetical protein
MVKVVYASLKPKKAVGKTSVETKVVTKNGKRLRLYKLDANSSTFDVDMSFVFRKNVEEARRTNKKILNSATRVLEKK